MNCRQATRLLSDALDRPLRAKEKIRLRYHLLLCRGCTRFGRQIRVLRQAGRAYTPGDD
jgi:hypothetical protein